MDTADNWTLQITGHHNYWTPQIADTAIQILDTAVFAVSSHLWCPVFVVSSYLWCPVLVFVVSSIYGVQYLWCPVFLVSSICGVQSSGVSSSLWCPVTCGVQHLWRPVLCGDQYLWCPVLSYVPSPGPVGPSLSYVCSKLF